VQTCSEDCQARNRGVREKVKISSRNEFAVKKGFGEIEKMEHIKFIATWEQKEGNDKGRGKTVQ